MLMSYNQAWGCFSTAFYAGQNDPNDPTDLCTGMEMAFNTIIGIGDDDMRIGLRVNNALDTLVHDNCVIGWGNRPFPASILVDIEAQGTTVIENNKVHGAETQPVHLLKPAKILNNDLRFATIQSFKFSGDGALLPGSVNNTF